MRTEDQAMTAAEFEEALDDALDGSLVSDTGASSDLEAALVRVATSETAAERARAVEEARRTYARDVAMREDVARADAREIGSP